MHSQLTSANTRRSNGWMPAPGELHALGGTLTCGIASLTRQQKEIYALGTDGQVWRRQA
jgi:hypothetical protein